MAPFFVAGRGASLRFGKMEMAETLAQVIFPFSFMVLMTNIAGYIANCAHVLRQL